MVGLGAAVALAGTFMPWLASGSVDRSSYDLIDLIDRLGFSPDGVMGVGVRAWPVVPLLLILSVVVLWQHLSVPGWVQITLWSVTAGYVGGTAVAVVAAPNAGLLDGRYGAWVTLVGALVLAAGAVIVIVARLRARATDLDP
jgi:hypothetical protein